jgi:hypothetical protein
MNNNVIQCGADVPVMGQCKYLEATSSTGPFDKVHWQQTANTIQHACP